MRLGVQATSVEEETFRLRDYHAFLRQIAAETAEFKAKQQSAFEAERERWAATEFVPMTEVEAPATQETVALPENCSFVDAPIAGNLWKVLVEVGAVVNANQPVAVVESMKNGNAGLRDSIRKGSFCALPRVHSGFSRPTSVYS
jgi:urea carboxylase